MRSAESPQAVLLATGGAAWEPAALEALGAAQPRVVVVRRCLDLAELLATAATGVAEVAVVSAALPGLDADSVDRLRRSGLRTVAVTGAVTGPVAGSGGSGATGHRERLDRMGIDAVLTADSTARLVEVLAGLRSGSEVDPAHPETVGPSAREVAECFEVDTGTAPLVAVCGPYGSTGRSTVALGVAAQLAADGRRVTLLDVDPYGGAVGLQLGMLEEVSGVLAAVRAANGGELTSPVLARLAREAAPGLRVVTGLPRADRWHEVRPQSLERLVEVARSLDDVVVADCGPGVPEVALDPFAEAPAREDLTATVLGAADVVLIVGAADPVGLTRLVRSVPSLLDACPTARPFVVVNRMRPGLGWASADVERLVASVAPAAEVRFLPEDRTGADRAVVAGRTLVEGRDGPLRRAIGDLAHRAVLPTITTVQDPARVRRRRADPARPRRGRSRRGRVRRSAAGTGR